MNDLETTNAAHVMTEEALREQIALLEEKLANKKERWEIGVQVRRPKAKEIDVQTEQVE